MGEAAEVVAAEAEAEAEVVARLAAVAEARLLVVEAAAAAKPPEEEVVAAVAAARRLAEEAARPAGRTMSASRCCPGIRRLPPSARLSRRRPTATRPGPG